MPFTGKATYSAGATLPELVEDVSDLIGINSPHETPLLDALGDPARVARSTVHEWLEDSLLPDSGVIADASISDPEADTNFAVQDASRFCAGDLVRLEQGDELMMVTGVNTSSNTLSVVRGYADSQCSPISDGARLLIVANASLEGADAAPMRFTTRVRKANYTQIFTSTVEVSGSELAVQQIGLSDELDYQKQQRTRELLRDLENCVINGRAPLNGGQGSGSVRRTMRGLLHTIESNIFRPGEGSFPAGATLSEVQLNDALRRIWKSSSGQVDLILVGGAEKRAINQFVAANRRFTSQSDSFRDLLSTYESDFGVCRIVLSRYVPAGHVLLLDSERIDVLPLSGRSFAYKPLAVTGDKQSGQIVGEYTLECRNESAHGLIHL